MSASVTCRTDALILVVDAGRCPQSLLQPVCSEEWTGPPQLVDIQNLCPGCQMSALLTWSGRALAQSLSGSQRVQSKDHIHTSACRAGGLLRSIGVQRALMVFRPAAFLNDHRSRRRIKDLLVGLQCPTTDMMTEIAELPHMDQ